MILDFNGYSVTDSGVDWNAVWQTVWQASIWITAIFAVLIFSILGILISLFRAALFVAKTGAIEPGVKILLKGLFWSLSLGFTIVILLLLSIFLSTKISFFYLLGFAILIGFFLSYLFYLMTKFSILRLTKKAELALGLANILNRLALLIKEKLK